QDDDAFPAGLIFAGLKRPADDRPHTHDVEEVRAHEGLPDALRLAARADEVRASVAPARDAVKADVVALQISEGGRGEGVPIVRVVRPLDHRRETVEVRKGNGLPEEGVGDAEHRGAGPDAKADGDYGSGGKSRGLAQHAAGIPYIL